MTTPYWIKQLLSRSDQEVVNLRLTSVAQYIPLYEEFLNHENIPYELGQSKRPYLLIPFPVNSDDSSFEEMAATFMKRFEDYLIKKYGDINPLGDN